MGIKLKSTFEKRPGVDWDNIKMQFNEIGEGDVDLIDLTQSRTKQRAFVNTVMNNQLPNWDPAPQTVGFEPELHGLAKQSKAQLNLKIFKTMTAEFHDSLNVSS